MWTIIRLVQFVLVIAVLLYVTSSGDATVAVSYGSGSMFTAVKSSQGDYGCAVGVVPSESFQISSAARCLNECQRRHGSASCVGVNARVNVQDTSGDIVCQLFNYSVRPVFNVQQGCKHFANTNASVGQVHRVCPASYTYVSAIRGCYKMVLNNLNWADAAQSCAAYPGGHLAFINSSAEQQAIADILNTYTGSYCAIRYVWSANQLTWWIGGQRIDPTANTALYWKQSPTTLVASLTYVNWISGEPNFGSGSGEACVGVVRSFTYQWYDEQCGLAKCFVCEVDL